MILKHLQGLASITTNRQKEYYSWLAENGKKYTKRIDVDLPSNIEMKGCYKNALLYSLNEKASYVEGFYFIDWFPVEHAFNLVNGKLVDITSQEFGFDVKEWFGVELSKDLICEYVLSDCPEWIMPLQYYYSKITKQKLWKAG